MTSANCLPPTSRDFLVYERIIVERATTRMAAEEVGLSQTRVRQIVHRVEEYLAATLAAADRPAIDRGRLRLAQCLAADRLHELYCDALEQWHATHESKFLTAVLRLTAAQSKLTAQPFTLGALAADAIEGPLDAPVDVGCISAAQCTSTTDHGPLTTAPSVEDCSNSPTPELPIEPTSPLSAAPTPVAETSYNAPSFSQPRAHTRPSAPAQTPPPPPAAIAELRLTPDHIDLTTTESFVPIG